MKNIILFFVLMLNFEMNAQLTANAGDDTVFCYQLNGTNIYSIGGSPSASNGVPPYTFEWSIAEPYQLGGSSILLSSDDFLNDTTLANPTIIDGFGLSLDSMTFFLKVTDLLGNSAQDSVRIGFSTFSYSMENNFFHILEGDTVFYPDASYVSGGLGTLTYLWQPNYGLIDSTSNLLWANPSVSTDYYCKVTDEFGCSSEPLVMNHVIVHYLDVIELSKKDNTILNLYPNPTNNEIEIQLKEGLIGNVNIEIVDEVGKVVMRKEFVDANETKISVSHLKEGIYFCKLVCGDNVVTKSFIKTR